MSNGPEQIRVLRLGARAIALLALILVWAETDRASAEGNAVTFAVTKSPPSQTLAVGATISWTITIQNTGDAVASGTLTMTDDVPDVFDTVLATGTGWTCNVNMNGLVNCTRDATLAAGAFYPEITVTGRAANCSSGTPSGNSVTVNNVARAFITGLTPTFSSTAVQATITGCPAFTVTKVPAGPTAALGDSFSWDITVTNSGGAATTGTVTLTDDLPQAFGNVTAEGVGWICTVNMNGLVQCTRSNSLASGASYPAVRITATPIDCSVTTVQNRATAFGGGTQGNFHSSFVPTTIVDCGAISGVLSLQGRTSSSPGGTGYDTGFSMATVTATRTDTTGQDPVTVSATSTGSFSFPNLPFGTYTLTAEAPGYLAAQRTGVVVTSGSTAVPTVQLLAGLVTEDDLVNIHDITVMLAAFGQSTPDRRNSAGRIVDLNGDGMVTIADVVLAINNFGKSGLQPW